MTMDSVTAGGVPAPVTIDDTIARVDLPRPLAPGDSVILRLRFEVQVPKPFDRLGHEGSSYAIGQWYPKVAVYDDLGWHPDPYHFLSEFYGDYGTFDVAITLPDRFWVGATGVLKSAEGGDNQIPLADRETKGDSVSVRLRVVPGGALRGAWPGALEVETDLAQSARVRRRPLEVDRTRGAILRVPRAAPVHYSYSWVDSAKDTRQEADGAGRPGPLRLLRASRDTTIVDTLRALAPRSAPGDTVIPSLKTLRFHADRVHDFGWVASPDYVRADTTWKGISIRALAFRDDQDDWSEQKAHVVSAMEFFSREVGPYAWPSFTSAEASMGGGAMEYPMLIMIEPDIPSRWLDWLDVTIAHEVAHNWFYGMLGSDERAYPWLDEGFAQIMEQRYGDLKHPRGFFKRRDLFPWTSPVRDFFFDENRYLARVYARDEQPPATPAEAYHSYPTYGVGAYSKPAVMLHSLAAYLGEPNFRAFLREYYRANLFRHPGPADVVKAASKVWGSDLEDWFRPWLMGTGIASYSIQSVHHERIEGERIATVKVRREGEAVQPVIVEARFADGSRERRLLPAGQGDALMIFGGESRLSHVVLDPDHEVIELNRLDNRSGLPTLRLKPLYDYPSAEAMTILYGPMIWHGRAEGARLGVWAGGRYLASPDFPDGIVKLGGSALVGTRRGDFSWSAWGGRRVGGFGARGRLDLETGRDAGLYRAGLRLGNLATAPGRLHPFRSWQLGIEYRDRYDLAPVDPRYWTPGEGLHGKMRLALDTKGPRRAEHGEIDGRAGGSAFRSSGDPDPEFQYERLSIEMRQRLDLLPRGNVHLSWRVFAGSAFDRPPREMLFDAAEGNRIDSLGRFYLNDRGPLVASGHYLMAGGGGLRGYRGRAALGKRVWGVSADMELPRLPVSFFADLGRVEVTGLGESAGQASPPSSSEAADLIGRPLGDAGLSYVYGPVRLTAPLWVGRPEPGEAPWKFRWLVSIERFPISF
jgi:hypothetical protein